MHNPNRVSRWILMGLLNQRGRCCHSKDFLTIYISHFEKHASFLLPLLTARCAATQPIYRRGAVFSSKDVKSRRRERGVIYHRHLRGIDQYKTCVPVSSSLPKATSPSITPPGPIWRQHRRLSSNHALEESSPVIEFVWKRCVREYPPQAIRLFSYTV